MTRAHDIDPDLTDRLLTTTRSVRKRLDLERPVEREVLLECVSVAQQAPSGSNRQGWSFVIVTDADKRRQIAELYRDGVGEMFNTLEAEARERGDDTTARIYSGAEYLSTVLDRVPAHVIPCIEGRLPVSTSPHAGPFAASLFGSILPAAWSFQLALRSRGLGSAWTTAHLMREREVADLLGIPNDVTQVALFPVAYYLGETFSPATRPPPETITHWDGWKV
jgi:nitroreductase